jgi:alkylation response protein AidB-like acyl-CoA dehydrogenase
MGDLLVMSIAITDEHAELARTVGDFAERHALLRASRALLETSTEELPKFWDDLCDVGWLGLHLPEQLGGSGFGLPELVVVVEALGRVLAPGPFVPTVIASALISAAAPAEMQAHLVPILANGTAVGAVALGGDLSVQGGVATGSAGIVLGGGLADVILVRAGADVVVVHTNGRGVKVEVPPNLDPTRRTARVTLDGTNVHVLPSAGPLLLDLARLIISAEATGIARECTVQASEYAKVRQQFGRPIATYQAVKHHCANMLVATELATAAVWDAARAVGDQLSYTAAVAAALAVPAAEQNAQLNIQVHGGIGFTWEHDAHLYQRRATVLQTILDPEAAAVDVTGHVRGGVRRCAPRCASSWPRSPAGRKMIGGPR